ncbi:MAG: alpha/beta hydrolase [Thiohalospira sp.]
MTDDIGRAHLHAFHRYDGLEEAPAFGPRLMLEGPAGPLEALVDAPADPVPGAPVAVVCHPHPRYAGTMQNKVTHMIATALADAGVVAVRFNFRGVGKSAGRYDGGRGEATDLAAVAGWARARLPGAPLWLAGFSFGAYVVMRAQAELEPARLLVVAPPVDLFDFTSVADPTAPLTVIQGGRDEVVSPPAVSEWAAALPGKPHYRWMADADHFFHGRMNRLREAVHREASHAIQTQS